MTCAGCETEMFKAVVIPGKGDFCKDCAPVARHIPHNLFPMVCDHISQKAGQPVTVNSLYHLRKLEKEHQVASVAFNRDEANWETPPQTDFSKITPWLHGKQRIVPHTEHSIAMERRMAEARRRR